MRKCVISTMIVLGLLFMGLDICLAEQGKQDLKDEKAQKDEAQNKKTEKSETEKTEEEPKQEQTGAETEEQAVESKMLLVVVDFTAKNMPVSLAAGLSDSVRSQLAEIGLYTVISREEMTKDLAAIKKKVPTDCYETRCLLRVGKQLNVTKAVGGEISSDGINYAVKMNMVDVGTGMSGAKVWIASECAEKDIPEMIRAGVLRLHGQEPEKTSITLKEYRGAEFEKYDKWAITAGATFALGIAYAMIDGSLTGRDKNGKELSEANVSTIDAPLSGIEGAFAHLGYDARAHGLGNAYVAVSNDASGILWNPAGISRVQQNEIAALYMKGIAGVSYLGAGYVGRYSRTGGYGAAILYNGDQENLWGETQIITSCGMLFDNVHKHLRPFAVGANGKLRMASTGSGAVGENASTGNSFGISVDAGFQLELADHIMFGAVARNVLNFQKWTNTYRNDSYNEPTPVTLVIGGAFHASQSLLLVMDGQIPVYVDQLYKVHMGIEKMIFEVLALRTGLSQNLDFNEDRRVMCGMGIRYMGFGLDASYEFAQESVFGGSLRFSTSYKF